MQCRLVFPYLVLFYKFHYCSLSETLDPEGFGPHIPSIVNRHNFPFSFYKEPSSGQIKDYEIGMCCFSTKHTHSIKNKSKYSESG